MEYKQYYVAYYTLNYNVGQESVRVIRDIQLWRISLVGKASNPDYSLPELRITRITQHPSS